MQIKSGDEIGELLTLLKFKLKVEMESEKYNQTKVDNSKDLEKVEMKLEKYNQTKKKRNSTKVLELLDFRTC